MAASISVTFADGRKIEITSVMGDLVQFELAHNGREPKTTSVSDMCWLVWKACRRTKQTEQEFEEWADGVTDMEASGNPLDVTAES